MAAEPQLKLTASECLVQISEALRQKARQERVSVTRLQTHGILFRQYTPSQVHASTTVALEGVQVLLYSATVPGPSAVACELLPRRLPFQEARQCLLASTYACVSEFVVAVHEAIVTLYRRKLDEDREAQKAHQQHQQLLRDSLNKLVPAASSRLDFVVDSLGPCDVH